MKVLVTGATGFVGSHLCELLIEQGHEVYSLVRNLNKAKEFNVPGIFIKGSLVASGSNKWISDLTTDLDCIVHTAGIVHSLNTKIFHEINTEATKVLFSDLNKKFTKLNFIFVSSLAAAGPANNLLELKESDFPKPVSMYGKSKLNAEEFLKENIPANWQLTILRPPMVIGPRDPAILDIFKMVKQGVILMAGTNAKEKVYSYVCVFDLVKLISIAVTTDTKYKNEIFYTSHPQSITMDEIISTIKKKMNKKHSLYLPMPYFIVKSIALTVGLLSKFIQIEFRLTPDKMHELLPNAWLCSGDKSTKDLDMSYDWDFEKTIEETFVDYQKRGWL